MFPHDASDVYANCGPNSMCTISNPQICSCMIGYQPKSRAEWDSLVWTSGCVSKNPFNCSRGEGFKRLKELLLRAYANLDATGGAKGSLLWFGDLIDVRKLIEYANQDLFIRVSASDLDSANSKWKVWVAVAISSAIVMLLVLLYICIFWKRKKKCSRPGSCGLRRK
ncbi:hypothetical protein NL676_007846 [Syzygium grande]|nr:hypothetical protein NL676_007846 [Syzygium grande]